MSVFSLLLKIYLHQNPCNVITFKKNNVGRRVLTQNPIRERFPNAPSAGCWQCLMEPWLRRTRCGKKAPKKCPRVAILRPPPSTGHNGRALWALGRGDGAIDSDGSERHGMCHGVTPVRRTTVSSGDFLPADATVVAGGSHHGSGREWTREREREGAGGGLPSRASTPPQ